MESVEKHLGINRAAIELTDKLVLRPNTLSHEGGLCYHYLQAQVQQFCLCMEDIDFVSAPHSCHCTGSGNEAYSSLSWLIKLTNRTNPIV